MPRKSFSGLKIFMRLVAGHTGQRTGLLIAKTSVQLLNVSCDSHVGIGLRRTKFKSIFVQRKSGAKIVRTPATNGRLDISVQVTLCAHCFAEFPRQVHGIDNCSIDIGQWLDVVQMQVDVKFTRPMTAFAPDCRFRNFVPESVYLRIFHVAGMAIQTPAANDAAE